MYYELNIDYNKLLGRDPIVVDMTDVFADINEKTVLVTGGGGSIGSELCRQIAMHNPVRLIIYDIYENNAFAIQQELKEKYPELDLVVLIGSVRDSRRINQVFEIYKPQITYHAAAHKHVPLMEDSGAEAIKNNVIGTYKTAYAALMNGCDKFVLISSDKAVNPTNIMGASKRICEMIIQSFAEKVKKGDIDKIKPLYAHSEEKGNDLSLNMSDVSAKVDNPQTKFVAVRFGNVLGSNGSVIPTFLRQIRQKKPVTVTDPEMTRYFMTIPEAVSLVLKAGCKADGGTIFVFDMGEPVKIVDLAKKLIEMYAEKPDEVEITFTGLRPGEKSYEETLMKEEGLSRIEGNRICIGSPIAMDHDAFLESMHTLMNVAYGYKGANDSENNKHIREVVKAIVPTYNPQQDKDESEDKKDDNEKVEKVAETAVAEQKELVTC